MIPVQKDFPPELLRRWRKVMKETPKHLFDGRWDNLHAYAVRCQRRENLRQWIEQWKLSQARQSWLYAAIGGALLVLIVFLVCGGCRE